MPFIESKKIQLLHLRQDAIIDGEILALDDKGRPFFQLWQGFDRAWYGGAVILHHPGLARFVNFFPRSFSFRAIANKTSLPSIRL
jgi:hypothetical protein